MSLHLYTVPQKNGTEWCLHHYSQRWSCSHRSNVFTERPFM